MGFKSVRLEECQYDCRQNLMRKNPAPTCNFQTILETEADNNSYEVQELGLQKVMLLEKPEEMVGKELFLWTCNKVLEVCKLENLQYKIFKFIAKSTFVMLPRTQKEEDKDKKKNTFLNNQQFQGEKLLNEASDVY